MKTSVDRCAVDLSAYPDLVVIYLGMKVRTFAGIKTLLGIGPQIQKAADEWPEGLLHVDQGILFSLFPLHVGMRWYWRDFESMERWTRSSVHRDWWKNFLKDSGGTGFWHETYCMRGGIEAIYDDVGEAKFGLKAFAPNVPARGSMFSARSRAAVQGHQLAEPEGMSESDLY